MNFTKNKKTATDYNNTIILYVANNYSNKKKVSIFSSFLFPLYNETPFISAYNISESESKLSKERFLFNIVVTSLLG